jgi:dipeptidase
VITFARENGFYEGSDENFSFSDVYAPLDFSGARGCEARVWSFFNRFADGMDVYTDYAMGYNLTNRMPLWVAPSEKISPKQVFDIMRDHYEGTPMDMTRDIGAGGHSLPYRWRPMNWEVNGPNNTTVEYLHERAIATQQTGFWFVGQARANVPAPATGILWFGTDDAATSPLTPIYSSSTQVPWCLSTKNGSMIEFSATSMFWVTNRIANFAYLRYDMIAGEVRDIIDEWENTQLERVAEIDAQASGMKPAAARALITRFSTRTANDLFKKWDKLDKYLLVKYIDGNVKKQNADASFKDNGNGANIPEMPDFPGYDQRWDNNVAAQDDGTLRVPAN